MRKRSTKVHACVFCSKLLTKLPLHFERRHKEEIEVQKFQRLPKKSKQRKAAISDLVNKGDYDHNMSVKKEGRGMVIPKYRANENANDLVPCSQCFAMYNKRHLWRHAKICKAKQDGSKPMKNQHVVEGKKLLPCPSETSKVLRDNVIVSMQDDEIKLLIENDELIMDFGCRQIEKLGTDIRFRQYIAQKLRELGRLLKEVRETMGKPVPLQSIFKPSEFNSVIEVVRKVCGFQLETNSFKIPSLAIKLGISIKQCCMIQKCKAIERSDATQKEECDDFIQLYDNLWNQRITASARKTLYKASFNKPLLLPLVGDVMMLNEYLQTKAEECADKDDREGFSEFLIVLLAQIICFNRRRCGEVQYLTVAEYEKSLVHQAPVTPEIETALTKFEVHMANSIHRIEVRGKKGKKVPIFLTKAMKSNIDHILRRRRVLCIDTPYIFALSNVPLRGYDCLRKMAVECGAKNPEQLTSTNLRKQLGTLMQALNLSEDEQDIVAKFMGHDIRVHRQFYRLTDNVLQAAKVTKVLAALNSGKLVSAEAVTVEENGKTFLNY